MGIGPGASVWAPGTGPLPPKEWSGKGRPPARLRRDEDHQPVTVKALALTLKESDWQTINWREGCGRSPEIPLCPARVRPAHEDYRRNEPRPEEWLVIEWPEDEDEPTKYWFSTLDASISFEKLDRYDQASLADRARLPRPQAGTWPWTLRRPGLAGLSSSRNALYRGLRLPDLRTGDDSPLRSFSRRAPQKICHSRRLQTQRLSPSAPSATCRTRSPPCVSASPSLSPEASPAAPAAHG